MMATHTNIRDADFSVRCPTNSDRSHPIEIEDMDRLYSLESDRLNYHVVL